MKDIEEKLEFNYELLSGFEKKFSLTSDVRERANLKEEMALTKAYLKDLEAEWEELQAKANSTPEVAATAPVAAVIDPLESHYAAITEIILQGKLVTVLGPQSNHFGRAKDSEWKPGLYPPDADELAKSLVEEFALSSIASNGNNKHLLAQVSQYAFLTVKAGPVYDKLQAIFQEVYQPNALYQFYAALPKLLREKMPKPRYPLLITANYDNLLERTFDLAGEPYDLLAYQADGDYRHKFLYFAPGDKVGIPVEDRNKNFGLGLDKRPIILKMYGMLGRENPNQNHLVITEDHFINYMNGTEVSKLLPTTITTELLTSRVLFLGYELKNWSLRVLLHRVWGEKISYEAWSVENDVEELDRKFWNKWDVELLPAKPEDYINTLAARLEKMPTRK